MREGFISPLSDADLAFGGAGTIALRRLVALSGLAFHQRQKCIERRNTIIDIFGLARLAFQILRLLNSPIYQIDVRHTHLARRYATD